MAGEVIYWQGRGEPIANLIDGLKKNGHTVEMRGSLEQILDGLVKSVPSLIIVDATLGEREVANRVVELTDVARLVQIPMFFLSRYAERRTDLLMHQYENFFAIDIPFHLPTVIEQAHTVCSTTDLKGLRERFRAEQRDGQRTERKAQDPANLATTHGGSLFASATSVSDFDDEKLVPKHPMREELENGLNEITESDQWAGVHARRVAFVSSAIANRLKLGEQRDTTIRTAGLLFNWGLKDSPGELMKHDFFQIDSNEMRQDIINGYERSASLVRRKLSDERAAAVLEAAAAITARRKPTQSKDIIEDAQSVLAVEMIDRACWAYGKWDAQGAYRMVRGIRDGSIIQVNPNVASSLIRVLGEAFDVQKDLGAIVPSPKLARGNDPVTVEKAIRVAEKEFGTSDLIRVEFADLQPGMSLARPLASMDGKIILPAGSVLDGDMILRLWQLAAIRPLDTPVIAVKSASAELQKNLKKI